MNTPTLNTQRLILRKFNENDLEAYQERYASIYQKKQGYAQAICLKENNTPIGYINIDLDKSHDLDYGLKKEY